MTFRLSAFGRSAPSTLIAAPPDRQHGSRAHVGVAVSQPIRVGKTKAAVLLSDTRSRWSCLPALPAGMLVIGLARRRQAICTRGAARRLRSVVRAAAGETEDASDLAQEAARLRAEAEELERAQIAERREARARDLLAGVRGSSIGPEELKAQLKQSLALDASLEQVQSLMAACKAGAGSLGFDELSSKDFDTALGRLTAEAQKAVRERREEEERGDAEAQTQEAVASIFSSGSTGDDRSFVIRLLSCLVYLLPILDVLEYALPILNFIPGAAPVFQALLLLTALKDQIPFGLFIFLIGLQFLASNRDLAPLLRFNMYQAVVLDVLSITPALFASFLSFELPEDLTFAISIVILGAILYSLVLTLLGKEPDGLGAISDATKRNLGRSF